MSDRHDGKRRRCSDAPISSINTNVENLTLREINSSPVFLNAECDPILNPSQKGDGMQKRSVSFGSLQVRRYDVEIGNNPSCRNGTPIQLGWNYTQDPTQCLEVYEASRQEEEYRRRNRKELLLPSGKRKNILKNAGHTELEIKDAEVMRVPSRLEHDVESSFRKISDLSCPIPSSFEFQDRKRRHHIPVSAMKNVTWDGNNCLSVDQRTQVTNPLFEYFALKRPVIGAKKPVTSNNSKSITILPRQSYGSISSSSLSSSGKSSNSLSGNNSSYDNEEPQNNRHTLKTKPRGSTQNSNNDKKSSEEPKPSKISYRRVLMPNEQQEKYGYKNR